MIQAIGIIVPIISEWVNIVNKSDPPHDTILVNDIALISVTIEWETYLCQSYRYLSTLPNGFHR